MHKNAVIPDVVPESSLFNKSCNPNLNLDSRFTGRPTGCLGTKQGFTLIELLVVVLIIGILAAVALPQYRVAVEKSRLTQQITLVDAVVRAQELYYMANGAFAEDLADLDFGLPSGCTFPGGTGDRSWANCGKFSINYKHGSNCDVHGSNGSTWSTGPLRYEKRMTVGPCTGGTFCHAETSNSVAQQVCKSMGGTNPTANVLFSGFTRYTLPY